MQPVSVRTTPDWDNIAEQIQCPLCKYNLRGIRDARCPECGYTFDWPDLLDPTRRLHPYLFEHHPERNVRSFWRTAAGALLPRRFWRTLQPVQPSRPRRLILYWWLTTLLFSVCALIGLFYLGGMFVAENLTTPAGRALETSMVNAPGSSYGLPQVLPVYGSVDVYLDIAAPISITPRVIWRNLYWRHWPRTLDAVWAAVFAAVWPWLTFGVIMMFRISILRAKVRPVHILRCVIYSFGTLFWLGIVVLVALVAWDQGARRFGMVPRSVLSDVVLAAGACVILAMLYQLATACRLYLRFQHSMLMVLAAQVVLVLAIPTLLWAIPGLIMTYIGK